MAIFIVSHQPRRGLSSHDKTEPEEPKAHRYPQCSWTGRLGLDMQVVYFKVRVPIGDGVTLRLPVMATITPRFYSPTQAQHLDRSEGRH
jgi:hypothetical protein